MSAAAPHNFRVASRRAQSLVEKHLASKRPPGSATKKSQTDKSAETPWPDNLRYAFYTVCAAAVPFSIGSVIAMSPRLRESLSDDTDPDENGMTSNNLVHLVRRYWGEYDYIPPVDHVQSATALPGRRLEWQDDNWSSLLAFIGLYSPKDGTSTVGVDLNEGIPISFENEPPANERLRQTLLARYLSSEYNPAGEKVRLTLLSNTSTFGDEASSRHDFEFRLPTSASLAGLGDMVNVSNVSDAVKKINSLFPGVNILHDDQRFDGSSLYHCVLDFSSDDDGLDEQNSVSLTYEGMHSTQSNESHTVEPSVLDTSKMILQNTSSNSSWAYVQDAKQIQSSTSPSKFGSSTNTSKSSKHSSNDIDGARIEHLKNQISTLQKELKDPTSLRDRGKIMASRLQFLISLVRLVLSHRTFIHL